MKYRVFRDSDQSQESEALTEWLYSIHLGPFGLVSLNYRRRLLTIVLLFSCQIVGFFKCPVANGDFEILISGEA